MWRSALTSVGSAPPARPVPLATVVVPETALHSLLVLPDQDTCVVSAENDGALHIVSLRAGQITASPRQHTGPVNALALAAGGRLVLSASDDGTIGVWDTTTWTIHTTLTGHDGMIRDVAAAGAVAISGGEDATVRVWELRTGDCLAVLDRHALPVDAVAISRDGLLAASASRDNHLLVWDLSNGPPRLHRELYGPASVVIPVTGSLYTRMRVKDLDTEPPPGHHDGPSVLAFDASGRLFSADREVIHWDPQTGRELLRFPAPDPPDGFAMHPTLPLLAMSQHVCVQVRRLDGTHVTSLGVGNFGYGVMTFTSDGRLVTAEPEGTIRVWPAVTGEEQEGSRHPTSIDTITINRTSQLAATRDADGTVMLWDLTTGERRRTIVHRGTASPLSNRPVFTHAGTALLTGDRDTVYVHDTASDVTRALPPPTTGTDSGLAPNGHRLTVWPWWAVETSWSATGSSRRNCGAWTDPHVVRCAVPPAALANPR